MRNLVHAVSILTACLGLLTAQASPHGTTDARFLAAGQVLGLPNPLVDTAHYDIDVVVINADPVESLTGPVILMLSIDGDTPTPLGEAVVPAAAVAPGDSFLVHVAQVSFDASRFQGGGITHDIIVWPVRLGSQTVDSTTVTRDFVHSPAFTSGHLGIRSVNLPAQLVEGQAYDLSVEVRNEDPSHALYHPVDLYLAVGNGTPTLLASGVYPPEALGPGQSFHVAVPGYVFDPARFQGGGITHDIIVWPMSIHVDQVDTLVKPVRWQARTTRPGNTTTPGGTLPRAGESLATQPGQVYPNPFSGHSPVWPVWLPQGGQVRLEIVRPADGRIVAVQSHNLPAGTHLIQADLADLPAGTYAYRLQTPAGLQQGSVQKHAF